MDEGVPDSAAPAPIFLGDMNSLEEIIEPKRDTFDILGFVVGFIVPPVLFVISIGLFFITGDWELLLLAIILGACVWPLTWLIITIMAYKKGYTKQAIGTLILLVIWIFILFVVGI
jgi:hypothetical protein